MTTISVPLQFWPCAGDVLARVPGEQPAVISEAESQDLLDLFEERRRCAERAGDQAAWSLVMCMARQLTAARIQASRWRRASGDIPRAA